MLLLCYPKTLIEDIENTIKLTDINILDTKEVKYENIFKRTKIKTDSALLRLGK